MLGVMINIEEGLSTVFLDVQASQFLLFCHSIQMLEAANVFWAQRLYLSTLASPYLHSIPFHPSSSNGRSFWINIWLRFVRVFQAETNQKSSPAGSLLASPSPSSTPSGPQKSHTPHFLPLTVNTPSSCCLLSLQV